jgi:hypothetical protein
MEVVASEQVWEETDNDELVFDHIRVIVRQGSRYLFEAGCLEGEASSQARPSTDWTHLACLPSKLRTGDSVNEACSLGVITATTRMTLSVRFAVM